MSEKTIDLTCAVCNLTFKKICREYKRQLKAGRDRFFCSRNCAAIKNNEENPRKGNVANLIADNQLDEYSPFRWYVIRGEYRDRTKGYGCDLTVEYLKELWTRQNGVCSLSGCNLLLPKNTTKAWEIKSPYNASLDRIDNSKGYMQGNVRFVAYIANIARSTFSDDQLIEFCKAVANK